MGIKMKEMDIIEVIVEKKLYADDGVHMGMHGWICAPAHTNDYWLVNFPQCGEHEDIATISIHEKDMRKIPRLDAIVNEEIAEQHRKKS
jgi:hypothetical protein